jgi:hypothetical protein
VIIERSFEAVLLSEVDDTDEERNCRLVLLAKYCEDQIHHWDHSLNFVDLQMVLASHRESPTLMKTNTVVPESIMANA